MNVSDLIEGQILRTISPPEPIMQALDKMESWAISALLVFEKNKFLGIITMVDIARAWHGQDGGTVNDIMTKADKVKFVTPEANLFQCSQAMDEGGHIHHLPVMDSHRKVVGIISSLDLVKALKKGNIYLYSEGLTEKEKALTGVRSISSVTEGLLASVKRHTDGCLAVIPEGPYVIPLWTGPEVKAS